MTPTCLVRSLRDFQGDTETHTEDTCRGVWPPHLGQPLLRGQSPHGMGSVDALLFLIHSNVWVALPEAVLIVLPVRGTEPTSACSGPRYRARCPLCVLSEQADGCLGARPHPSATQSKVKVTGSVAVTSLKLLPAWSIKHIENETESLSQTEFFILFLSLDFCYYKAVLRLRQEFSVRPVGSCPLLSSCLHVVTAVEMGHVHTQSRVDT